MDIRSTPLNTYVELTKRDGKKLRLKLAVGPCEGRHQAIRDAITRYAARSKFVLREIVLDVGPITTTLPRLTYVECTLTASSWNSSAFLTCKSTFEKCHFFGGTTLRLRGGEKFVECYLRGVSIYPEADQNVQATFTDCQLLKADVSPLVSAPNLVALGAVNGWSSFMYRDAEGLRIQAGCRNFSVEEGRRHWRNKKDRAELLAAIAYGVRVFELRDKFGFTGEEQ